MDSIASSIVLCPIAIMSENESRSLTDKFMLRLPDGMRGRVKLAAEQNNRSMNSEIVATLEEKYPVPELKSDYETIIAEVMADGQTRVISKANTNVYVSKTIDGRVILDVVDSRPLRTAEK